MITTIIISSPFLFALVPFFLLLFTISTFLLKLLQKTKPSIRTKTRKERNKQKEEFPQSHLSIFLLAFEKAFSLPPRFQYWLKYFLQRS
jgi:hypothetical protein